MNNTLLPKPKYLWVPIGMAWSMVTMRPEAFCLSVLLLITLSLPTFRRKAGLLGIIGGLLALLPFAPIGITATDAPGPPKLIECCLECRYGIRKRKRLHNAGNVCSAPT
ncbi:hypothetical protein KFZ76_16885 [Methylovulum psychrotolerans]|uniref:hypothetical protein n=1 Tax=Methylovulum psychrotolerans TaxID=1704499 RepID=UPI001BFF467E|nr:hypothetical protein [Methylovulum psychrotolerans]MBT9099372.1 hypothetical protein [Methylovulum psychrotolerans]